jgi:DNA-directed RNA polymerase subunit RPC12/RpoP
MKGSDIGKLAFAVVAIGVAAYCMRGFFKGDPADSEVLWRICGNPACHAEFSLLRSESKKAAIEKRPIPCPKCGSTEAAMAFSCSKCQHATLAGVHGSVPKVCAHCKEPFGAPKPAGG